MLPSTCHQWCSIHYESSRVVPDTKLSENGRRSRPGHSLQSKGSTKSENNETEPDSWTVATFFVSCIRKAVVFLIDCFCINRTSLIYCLPITTTPLSIKLKLETRMWMSRRTSTKHQTIIQVCLVALSHLSWFGLYLVVNVFRFFQKWAFICIRVHKIRVRSKQTVQAEKRCVENA